MLLKAARHPFRTSLAAMAASVLAVLVIADAADLHAIGQAFDHVHAGWLLAALICELLSERS